MRLLRKIDWWIFLFLLPVGCVISRIWNEGEWLLALLLSASCVAACARAYINGWNAGIQIVRENDDSDTTSVPFLPFC